MVTLFGFDVDGHPEFDFSDVPAENREAVAAHMAMVGTIMADGQVTMEEASQLLALAYPDLAGHPQMASVLQASSEAVQALRDDGKVSLPEAIAISLTLLAGVPSMADLASAAKAVAKRLLALRKPKP